MKLTHVFIAYLTTLLLFLCNFSVVGQIYREKTYNYYDGLSSEIVQHSFTDRKGLLYVITQRDVSFFDGYHFIPVGGPRTRINSSYSNQNTLYLEDGMALKKRSLSNFTSQEETVLPLAHHDSDPNNDHYENLYVDAKGIIWSSDFNFLKCIDGGQVQKYELFPGATELRKKMQFLQVTPTEFWLVGGGDLISWQEKFKQVKTTHFSDELVTVVPFDDQHVLAGTKGGKIILLNIASKSVVKELANVDVPILGFSSIKDNMLVYTNSSIYEVKNQEVILLHYLNGKQIAHVHPHPHSGILWVSTNKGLVKLTPIIPGLQHLAISQYSEQGKIVIDITESSTGEKYVLNQKGEVWSLKASKWHMLFENAKGLEVQSLYCLNEQLYFVAKQGIWKFQHGHFKQLPFNNIADQELRKMVIVNGQVWLLYDSKPIKRFWLESLSEVAQPINNDFTFWKTNKWNDLFVDEKQQVWLVGWMPKSYGICFYDAKTDAFLDISKRGFSNDKGIFVGDYFNRIAQGRNGKLLFSAYGGFNVSDANGKIFQAVTMLNYPIADSYVTGMAEDEKGNIFFGTGEGLHILRSDNDKMVRIDQSAGIPTNVVSNGFYKFKDGTIGLGIDNGILLVDPEKLFSTNIDPPFIISQIRVNGQLRLIDSKDIHLKKDEGNLTVYFSNLSYKEFTQLHYYYQFKGDKEWISLGSLPELSFNHLEPGKYHVTIKAIDFLNNEFQQQLSISLEADPPFLKSIWFKILVSALLILVLFIYFNVRLRQKTRELRYEKRLKEAEMDSLRTQMNPHFMFNTLNSINSFIIQSKSKEASKYLTSFSKLMRNILENSKHQYIPLAKELQTLKLYIELESARLEHGFGYSIQIAPEVEQEMIDIPPMLIQPFVENSIWHGLTEKTEPGFISISLELVGNDFLQISITDNGVGRKRSFEKKRHQHKDHTSYGVQITLDRLKLFNKENELVIHDLEDDSGMALGTKVVLTLKTRGHESDID